MNEQTPVVDCTRVRSKHGDVDTLRVVCPSCWTYRGAFGSGDVDATGTYKKRPRRARPVTHIHGAVAPRPGSGDGDRGPHCFVRHASVLGRGYVLREVRR